MTRSKKAVLSILAAIVAIVVFAGVRVASFAPAATGSDPAAGGALGFPWRGAIHAHSSFSDGGGDVDEIMAAANEAGVHFIVLSDHNPLGPQERPRPGWYGDVLLIVAEEISTDEGHLLAFGVPPHRYRFGPTARQALRDIESEGGWALVAHGDHQRQAWSGGWGGTAGLELMNLSSAWSRTSTWSKTTTIASAVFDRDYAAVRMIGADWPALSLWDALTELSPRPTSVRRPRVGIGAADAHGPLVGSLPSYASTLAALTTLVWIDEPAGVDGRSPAELVEGKLLAALRAGRAAVETAALGDARGFTFTARAAGATAAMGDLVAFEHGPWSLSVGFDASVDAEIVVLRDGREIARERAPAVEVEATTPGTYRVEVFRDDIGGAAGAVPWLVGNPIYVWPEASVAASRVFPVPPLPPPAVSRDLLGDARFVANQRDVSRNTVEARDGGVSWSLSLSPDADPDAFAAMAWREDEPMDWSDHQGLVVDLGAAQPMRVSFELRTVAANGAGRTWVYSLRAAPDAVPRAVPWTDFRSTWAADDYRADDLPAEHPTAADLERVEGVYVVVTPRILARGSNAMLRLRRLGLFGPG